MSIWEFRCVGERGNDLCYNGGNCSVDANSKEICVCSSGFEHDFVSFHFPNCAQSVNSNRDFFLFYVPLTVFTGLLFLCWVPSLRNEAKEIGIIAFCCLVVTLFAFTSIYVQNGCYEACAVLFSLNLAFSQFTLQKAIIVILSPVYALQRKSFARIEWMLRTCSLLSIVPNAASGIAMLVLTRTGNEASYNFAVFGLLATLFVFGIADFAITFYSAAILLRHLSAVSQVNINGHQGTRHSWLVFRLRLVQINAINFIVPFVLLLISIPTVISIYGSFPYFYVVIYIIGGICAFSYLAATLFVKPQQPLRFRTPTSNTRQETDQKNNSAIAASAPQQQEMVDADELATSTPEQGDAQILPNISGSIPNLS